MRLRGWLAAGGRLAPGGRRLAAGWRMLIPGALFVGVLVTGTSPRAASVPNDAGAVAHALDRLAYGARPGEVDRVRQLGLAKWIDQQLHPERIEDTALAARLTEPPPRPERFDDQMAMRRWSRQSVQALSAARLTRAIYSERQLQEQLVDFWFNHFNVFAGKGRTAVWLEEYERTAIRPHVLGRFRDLLEATAKSPAMLFYLDNWLSADPASADAATRRAGRAAGAAQPPPQQPARRRGLNENYARELLELHTLGVDGGYTQQDVFAVARAFTGWTIAPARAPQGRAAVRVQAARGAIQEGDFRFAPMLHDRGEKIVLGHTIRDGGIDDGKRVLDILARHPATAQHVAYKLAQRFVSDEPPPALVARAATTFRDTDGNLRDVVRTIITSDEFLADAARKAKVKTPLEFVVSGVRAAGREVADTRPLLNALTQMGMPLYMCQPPTGYEDTADAWVSAGALVARMNIAQRIGGPVMAPVIGGPEFQRR